jgi:hypothetical protein
VQRGELRQLPDRSLDGGVDDHGPGKSRAAVHDAMSDGGELRGIELAQEVAQYGARIETAPLELLAS